MVEVDDSSPFTGEQLDTIRESIPEANLISCLPQLIKFCISVTEERSVACTCYISRDNSGTIQTIVTRYGSRTYPPQRSLDGLQAAVTARCNSPELLNSGCGQVGEAWNCLHKALAQKNLLICADEVFDAQRLFLDNPVDHLKLKESKGTIEFRCEKDRFFLEARLQIPLEYPKKKPLLAIVSSNFPSGVLAIYAGKAEAMAAEQTKLAPGSSTAKTDASHLDVSAEDATTLDHKQIRHDVQFLKERKSFASSTRFERRLLRNFDHREVLKEADGKLTSIPVNCAPDAEIPTCVYGIMQLLICTFVRSLPRTKCANCDSLIMKAENNNDPKQSGCGHWFHSDCLRILMCNPPFGQCPVQGCDKKLSHPEWNIKLETLERRWMKRQTHEREMEEMCDFLGL